MAVNSRRKGKVGELEAAAVLRELFGWDCGRSAQHCGTPDSADLRVSNTPGLWFEIKRVQKLNVPAALRKAVSEAGRKTAVLMHRPNRYPDWLLTIRLSDLPQLAHAFNVAEDSQLAASAVSGQASGRDPGGEQPAESPRTVPASRRQGTNQDQPQHGPDDGRDSTGRVVPHSQGRVPNTVRRRPRT